jgi:membrane-bound metal-dependent hydrolase YbcI (DUF457 family)
MYAIGHFALGYLAAKGTSKALKTKINLPLVFAVSVLPDIDLALGYLTGMHHRVITHSLITYTIILIPFLLLYGKRALPYYAAVLTHSLIGDFFTGGLGLFWPITDNWYGILNIQPTDLISVVAELVLFAATLAIMFKTKELQSLLKPSRNSLWLFIAFVAVLGPLVQMGFQEVRRFGETFEGALPPLLVAPSVFWLVVFGYAMLLNLRRRGHLPVQATSAAQSQLTAKQQENRQV